MSAETEPPTATDYAFDVAENAYMRLSAVLSSVVEWLELEKKWNSIKQFGSDHPIVALFIAIATVMCMVPVLCFIVFVVCSFSIMFTVFVFIEGFLVTLALFILFLVLCIITFISLGACLLVCITIYTFLFAQRLSYRLQDGFLQHNTSTSQPSNIGPHEE